MTIFITGEEKISRRALIRRGYQSDFLRYINNKGNNNPNQVKDKELLKKYMIGAVLIPLFYLINFFYSNFK